MVIFLFVDKPFESNLFYNSLPTAGHSACRGLALLDAEVKF